MIALKDNVQKYHALLEEKREQISREIRLLEQEGRQDEANLAKVKLNIVNVFETVAAADEKAVSVEQSDAWRKFHERYIQRFSTLTKPWCERLAQAKLHQDAEVVAVEEAKLETAAWIEKAFRSLEEK